MSAGVCGSRLESVTRIVLASAAIAACWEARGAAQTSLNSAPQGSVSDLREFQSLSGLSRPASYNVRARSLATTESRLADARPEVARSLSAIRRSGQLDSGLQHALADLIEECSADIGHPLRGGNNRWTEFDHCVEFDSACAKQQQLPIDPREGQSLLFTSDAKLSYSGRNSQLTVLDPQSGLEILRPSFLYGGLLLTEEQRAAARSCEWSSASLGDTLELTASACPGRGSGSERFVFDSMTRLPIARIATEDGGASQTVELYSWIGGVVGDTTLVPDSMQRVRCGVSELLIQQYDISDYSVVEVVDDPTILVRQRTLLVDQRRGGSATLSRRVERWPESIRALVVLIDDPAVPADVDRPTPGDAHPQVETHAKAGDDVSHDGRRVVIAGVLTAVLLAGGILWLVWSRLRRSKQTAR